MGNVAILPRSRMRLRLMTKPFAHRISPPRDIIRELASIWRREWSRHNASLPPGGSELNLCFPNHLPRLCPPARPHLPPRKHRSQVMDVAPASSLLHCFSGIVSLSLPCPASLLFWSLLRFPNAPMDRFELPPPSCPQSLSPCTLELCSLS